MKSARLGLCTLALLAAAEARALPAELPSFGDGAIHCPDGRTIPWSKTEPPSDLETSFDCSVPPTVVGGVAKTTTLHEMTVAEASLRREYAREADDKHHAAALENQHVLDGNYGQWAAFSTAWVQDRPSIYLRLLGKWTGYVAVFAVVSFMLFGRKSAR
jgi:hypothetical protein